MFIVALVYFDRDAYTDNWDGSVSLIDAIYYATVTITTTGYGDITPITPTAPDPQRVLVTPMRILFLVLLVGTTLEVLANEGRRMLRDNRWRKHMRNHVVVDRLRHQGPQRGRHLGRPTVPTRPRSW